jgi:hypothetical protein
MTEPETPDAPVPDVLAPDAHAPDALAPDAEPTAAEGDVDALERAESEAAAEAAAVVAPVDPAKPAGTDEPDDVLTSNDYSVAFSPRQVAVGLAIVAGLIAVVAARRRGRKRSGESG